MNKVVSALAVLVGGLASVFELLVAFNVHVSADQQTAIAAVAGLTLTVLGIFFHPATQTKLGNK